METHVLSSPVAAQASVDDRSSFLVRTYLHLFGAIAAFVALEVALFASGAANTIAGWVFNGPLGGMGWLVVLGAFMGVGYFGEKWAMNGGSRGRQYAGLGIYIVAEALIFVPLLFMAVYYAQSDVLGEAALSTLVLFGALTGIVLVTRKDFSFLRSVLMFGGIAAMGLIVVSVLFKFELGVIFSYAMVALACGYILYTTSNMLHRYRTDQHVAAALALFASVALLFWYILRIFMSRD